MPGDCCQGTAPLFPYVLCRYFLKLTHCPPASVSDDFCQLSSSPSLDRFTCINLPVYVFPLLTVTLWCTFCEEKSAYFPYSLPIPSLWIGHGLGFVAEPPQSSVASIGFSFFFFLWFHGPPFVFLWSAGYLSQSTNLYPEARKVSMNSR